MHVGFQLLEENIVSFVKSELKKFQRILSPDYSEAEIKQEEDEDVNSEEKQQKRSNREALLKIILHFLRMKREDLAKILQSSKRLVNVLIW